MYYNFQTSFCLLLPLFLRCPPWLLLVNYGHLLERHVLPSTHYPTAGVGAGNPRPCFGESPRWGILIHQWRHRSTTWVNICVFVCLFVCLIFFTCLVWSYWEIILGVCVSLGPAILWGCAFLEEGVHGLFFISLFFISRFNFLYSMCILISWS